MYIQIHRLLPRAKLSWTAVKQDHAHNNAILSGPENKGPIRGKNTSLRGSKRALFCTAEMGQGRARLWPFLHRAESREQTRATPIGCRGRGPSNENRNSPSDILVPCQEGLEKEAWNSVNADI
ncbi:hypothetical protein AAFF_G00178110 [Aldrovandia affinis]|uniref:Uncharacterized protein n=1 Tax=Aldrovandia affinis TaxID=143900 RepID=A0AAD7RKZ1_9TELE|nr:hypothetical protein AAFF_G00178110 [Aldrovandia affinis]